MDCIKFKNEANMAELYIHGDIVDDSWKWMYDIYNDDTAVFPSDIRESLKEVDGKELHVHINSGGGHVFAGTAISNFLQNRKGHTVAIIDGLAGSIASVIACGCDEVRIPSNAYFMIHKPYCDVRGNADDIRRTADTLDVLQEGIVNAYAKHAKDGVSRETLHELVNQETWFTGDAALEYFNFKQTNALDAVASVGSLAQEFFNAQNIEAKVEPAAEVVETKVEVEPQAEVEIEETTNKSELERMQKEVELVLATKGMVI